MKRIFIYLFLLANLTVFAQDRTVLFRINHQLNGAPFQVLKTIVKDPANNYYFNIEELRYYVSNIKLIHDGGKITAVPDSYLLLNVQINETSELGKFNVTKLEAVEFSIGVDQDKNHLDPTTYPEGHPLAMQNPTMHWGWAAGYRFVTLEGYAGTSISDVSTNYQIHSLGNQLYKTLKINTNGEIVDGKLRIELNADYRNLLAGIKAQTGVIAHGSTGASVTLMKNMSSVFTAANSVSVKEVTNIKVELFPNPTNGEIIVNAPLNNTDNQQVEVMNALGQVILTASKNTTQIQLQLPTNEGAYWVVIKENDRVVGREKVVVVR